MDASRVTCDGCKYIGPIENTVKTPVNNVTLCPKCHKEYIKQRGVILKGIDNPFFRLALSEIELSYEYMDSDISPLTEDAPREAYPKPLGRR